MTWIVTYDYIHNNITYSIITINTASDVRLIGASFWQTIVYPCKHLKWKGWWTSIKDAHKHKTANNTKQSVKKDMNNIGSKKRIYCTDKILIVKKIDDFRGGWPNWSHCITEQKGRKISLIYNIF